MQLSDDSLIIKPKHNEALHKVGIEGEWLKQRNYKNAMTKVMQHLNTTPQKVVTT